MTGPRPVILGTFLSYGSQVCRHSRYAVKVMAVKVFDLYLGTTAVNAILVSKSVSEIRCLPSPTVPSCVSDWPEGRCSCVDVVRMVA